MKTLALILMLLSTPTTVFAIGGGPMGGTPDMIFPPTIPEIDGDKVAKFYGCFFKAGCNPFTIDLSSDEDKDDK